jgi:hypothetical protein
LIGWGVIAVEGVNRVLVEGLAEDVEVVIPLRASEIRMW